MVTAAKRAWPFWLALLGFLTLFVLSLPYQIVAMKSDDFGYILSITDSIARHRLVTNNWLAPLAASNTAASIAVYFLTGSFYTATYGMLLVYAALFCSLLYFNLRPQLPQVHAAILVLAVAIFPVVFFKLSDFTSSAQSWVLFLAALLAFRYGRTALFTLFVIGAFANRQNYIGLFAMPAWATAAYYYKHRTIDSKNLMAVVIGLAGCMLAMRAIPANFFRAYVMSSFITRNPVSILTHGATYLLFFLGFYTAGNIASTGFKGLARPQLRWPLAVIGVAAAFLLMRYAAASEVIRFEASPFNEMRRPLSVLLVLLLTAGAVFAPLPKLAKDPLFWGMAGVYGVSTLNPTMWDYYMVEAVLAGLILGSRQSPTTSTRRMPWILLPYAAGCLLWVFFFAKQVTENEKQIIAYEELLRSGQIGVHEISREAFAYCQYKLFDLAAAEYAHKYQSGFPYPDCNVFLGDSTVVISSADRGPAGECQKLSLSGSVARSLAAMNRQALRCQAPPPPVKLNQRFHDRPFPLNDAEWRQMIKENRLSISIK